jgi:molybdopterin-synthase adenylyltransferase
MEQLDRNVRFFGREGQERISRVSVVIVGCGGLGSHVVQQLAYLGVNDFTLVDDEDLDVTNKNRYVTAFSADPTPGTAKVALAERLVRLITPSANVRVVRHELRSSAAFRAVASGGYVFGCLDNDGARLILTELCAAYRRPYLDLATEIIAGDRPVYGGRVFASWGDDGCLVCRQQLDLVEARTDLENPAARTDRASLYGVSLIDLDNTGPSVISINGVVASLAVTEFAVAVAQLRRPHTLLTYRGDLGRLTVTADVKPNVCYYCDEIYGTEDASGVERYLLNCEPVQH